MSWLPDEILEILHNLSAEDAQRVLEALEEAE